MKKTYLKKQRKNQNLCLGIHKTETVGTTIIFLRENTFQNHKAAGTTTITIVRINFKMWELILLENSFSFSFAELTLVKKINS
ncbi:hypothetical protein LEP1GSC049_1512 [Leptospira kirschneri serovar Cynopteri str. 3522 CT]|nr:hypothetical protein LEP1GSC065_0195 [Leptospira kirschneri serovar Sokoine str. RM1]EPG48878.1 hypothetical protein LEP1GSC049_1512 [Leptospira kirschneri serovar Cynopteri str. 3522 CT]